MKYNVLVLDDEEDIGLYLSRRFEKEGLTHQLAVSAEDAFNLLKEHKFDIFLMDYRLPGLTGLEFYMKSKESGYADRTMAILMTAYGSMETGLEAIKAGCYDYIIKPFNIEDLLFRIKRGIQILRLQETVEELKKKSLADDPYAFIGESDPMRKLMAVIKTVAPMDVTVLIEGETGTGKEVVARAIHRESPRKDASFIPVNCGAIPENLLESELFGYEKGAFTGAQSRKFGLFESAQKGTIFLDEVNSLSLSVQVKLLRFIETGEFIKVGGNLVLKSDVRLIAASNQDLEKLVEQNRFRQDLFFRLNVMRIRVPQLSQHPEDIPLLAEHFLAMFCARFGKKVVLDPAVLPVLAGHEWKGNVRELKNVIQTMVLMTPSGTITLSDLPSGMKPSAGKICVRQKYKDAKAGVLRAFEKEYFHAMLLSHGGNVLKTAGAAGIDRTHLIKKLKELGLNSRDFKRKRT